MVGTALLLCALLSLQGCRGLQWRRKQPQQPNEADGPADSYQQSVMFYIFNRDFPEGVEVQPDVASFLAAGYNSDLPTMVIIHGFGNNIEGGIFTSVAGALLQVGEPVNIIGVDWGRLCRKPFYLSARRRVAGVGARVASVLRLLVDAGLVRDLHIVGHSLGAHVAGCTARQLDRVRRVTGLDPAFPFFFNSSTDRLSPSDAGLVDVIHTNGGYLGCKQPLGHVDYYPNGGGVVQPGCRVEDVNVIDSLSGHCSHARAFQLFGESILDRQAFPAIRCDSLDDVTAESCPETEFNGRMGLNVEYSSPGLYFLRTRAEAPFSLNETLNFTTSEPKKKHRRKMIRPISDQ